MPIKKHWSDNTWIRILQHIFFWILSYYVFLYLFKVGNKPERIDFIYAAIFHAFLIPPVYINLAFLVPRLGKKNFWIGYIPIILLLITFFSWFNLMFFSKWSNAVLPDYFFISYFTFFQIALFFIVYISITTLVKLSKSWFTVNSLQKELLVAERQRSIREKEMLELEAKALRAQMNPHFIFNCMNSIKSLIQEKEIDKGVAYLTTFSKLIRTLFNNADKKEISLFDEIETCKLYLQLEAMRFDTKFSYKVDIDDSIDLKSVQVPALIIQPFIENAIWHGLMPKEGGGEVTMNVKRTDGVIQCIIDDNGIGREQSNKIKPRYDTHQSKGIGLTQARLELDKLLNDREDSIYIIDKMAEDGKSGGTQVIVTFAEIGN